MRKEWSYKWTINDIYNDISNSEIRNRLIIEDVIRSVEDGRNPIVLTERTSHVELLADILSKRLPNVIALTGGKSAKESRNLLQHIAEIPQNESIVLVATGKYVGEGFDLPRLDTLFLAMPISWKGTLQQYAGRLHRLYDNKNEVQIYDYVDIHVPMLEKMYQKRLKGYSSIGYKAKGDAKPIDEVNIIFDSGNFMPVFSNDIITAKNELIIVSPFVSKRRINMMLGLINTAINNGTKITVITRPESDYKEKDLNIITECFDILEHSGIKVFKKSRVHQKFAIIDQRIVWYGSVNLLSFGISEESIMRLESVNIANELAGTL